MDAQLRDKAAVGRGPWDMTVVEIDGEDELGMFSGMQIRREATKEALEEIYDDVLITVEEVATSEKWMLSGSLRGPTEKFFNLFIGDGRAPTIQTRETVKFIQRRIKLLSEDKKRVRVPWGMPQTHDSTVFPPPTGPTLAEGAGAGTFSNVAQYAWSIPVYINDDIKHGITAANFTLANFSLFTRGVHYGLGTPSASATVTPAAGSADLLYSHTEPTTGPKPTHYLVIVAQSNTINHSTARVSAILPAGTLSVTIADPGTPTWSAAAAPSLAEDMQRLDGITVSSGARLYAKKAEGVDWNFDEAEGTINRIDGGVFADGAEARYTMAVIMKPKVVQKNGGASVTELIKHIRLSNFKSDGTNPASRRANGVEVDLFRCNLAKLSQDGLTQGDTGYHQPVAFSGIEVQKDATQGCHVQYTLFGNHAGLIDFYSNAVSPAAAPV